MHKKNNLPNYFRQHLNNDVIAYVSKSEREIIACVFLLVVEKPMSPAFPTGKTGTVLNVYTCPDYRNKGYARNLMNMLLADAAEMGLDIVELKATEDGYNLYRSLGFCDSDRYRLMKWENGK
ncbi:MAG: GNAT family N-acetyltransferase [Eubacteriales bacterium]|nr:GNAT family N-acetyltransferase [Eubacteriales bacterium]